MKGITFAAVAFGAAVLASVPALAQSVHYGKALNDGGLVDVTAPPPSKPVYKPQPPAPVHYGKAVDDGGLVEAPTAPAPKITLTQNPSHIGRPVNDGGL